MENPKYEFESTSNSTTFEFISEGPKGRIVKIVKYTEYPDLGFFNLGFGDKLDDENDFDDKIVTDNGDSIKVLATVAETVYRFTDAFPFAFVFATGNSLARKRLYRMAISNSLYQINKDFDVLGFIDGAWENFEKNRDYIAFLIKRKLH